MTGYLQYDLFVIPRLPLNATQKRELNQREIETLNQRDVLSFARSWYERRLAADALIFPGLIHTGK